MDEKYAEIIFDRPVERFLREVIVNNDRFDHLVIVSPFMGVIEDPVAGLEQLVRKIDRDRTFTYVVTCPPEQDWHSNAVGILSRSDFVEIRYNPSLHAKLYVAHILDGGFAMLGSGNLTPTSIERNIEIGVMIHARGRGRDLVHELYHWGAVRLRTLPESRIVKKINYLRRR